MRDHVLDAVVIGASAGGIEALSALLPSIPATCQASFFIVVHLPRQRHSLLPEIFAPKCALPVVEAQDKEPVKPGTVYFAPPDYHLLLDEGPTLSLSVDDLVHYSRPSVDVLFETAAEVYGPRLLGILLSGANQDGAVGLEAVKQAGGVTLAQDPNTAQASAMPEAAVKRGAAQHVLNLEQLVAYLRAMI